MLRHGHGDAGRGLPICNVELCLGHRDTLSHRTVLATFGILLGLFEFILEVIFVVECLVRRLLGLILLSEQGVKVAVNVTLGNIGQSLPSPHVTLHLMDTAALLH